MSPGGYFIIAALAWLIFEDELYYVLDGENHPVFAFFGSAVACILWPLSLVVILVVWMTTWRSS